MRLHRLGALTICLVLLLSGSASVSAARRGVLSQREYQQLRVAQQRIRSLATAKTGSFSRARTVCTRIHAVTPLVGAVRLGCLDLIRLAGDDDRLKDRATKCGIDPSSESAILTCLVPAVRSYYQDAEAFYQAERRVDQLARARGFSRRCVAVVGDSPGNIAAEGRLAASLKAAVRALQHQNPEALPTLSDQIAAAARSIQPGPSSLSVCPHD